MASTRRFIIVEPVRNWAYRKDFWGRIAAKLSDAGAGPEHFRYDADSLREALAGASSGKYRLDFSIGGKEAFAELRWDKSPIGTVANRIE